MKHVVGLALALVAGATVAAEATFRNDAAKLRLLDKDRVSTETPVVSVRAWSDAGEVTLYVNGVEFGKATPDDNKLVAFKNIVVKRGVTDFRVEADGYWFDVASMRYGRTEAPTGKVEKCVNPRTDWFRDARFGLFIHWGLYAIPGKGEWTYANDGWRQSDYKALAQQFNPKHYDPYEWAQLAKAAGMKYVVFTTRHHDGFCMFDSHYTDFKVTNTPYGRDALKELLDAFRSHGLKVGFYHSLPDWQHPGYADPETPICIQTGKVTKPTQVQIDEYHRLIRNHVNQLTSEYGKIDIMFFDYTSKFRAEEKDPFCCQWLINICKKNQPDMLINDRLAYFKDGEAPYFDYYTPEITVPNYPPLVHGREMMWETCASINDHWGFCSDDENWKSPEAVEAGLVGCVSRGGNLLLNIGPTADGEFPKGAVKVLEELAKWNEKNGESIHGCGPSEYVPPFGCAYTQKDAKTLYCHFQITPLGDVILNGMEGKVKKITHLRTGKDVELVHFWGFETLRPGELRIRPLDVKIGDVLKIELK